MSTNKISIVIVNYNSSEKLNFLLNSIHYINKIIDEIIVIDNNSRDKKIINNKIKKLCLIKNHNNVGFSKAVNQGIKLSKNEIILLLNPDCTITDSTPINTFLLISENNKIGIAGGRIMNSNSSLKHYTATTKPNFFTGLFEFTNLKKIFPNNIFSKTFWIEKNNQITKPTKVFSLCGAFLFIRKHGGKNFNYFNENYFLYLEDLDFGYVIQNNNQLAIFDPNSHVNHVGGGSNDSKYKTVLSHWYKSRKIFFLNNLPKYQGIILYIIYSMEEILLKIYHKTNNTPYA